MTARERLQQIFEGIRDERGMYANTATRIGNAFLALLSYLTETGMLLKDEGGTVEKLVRFLEGIKVGKGDFGIDGEGNGNLLDLIVNGVLTVTNLNVTGAAHFYELIVDKIKSAGGAIILTPADGFVAEIVEHDGEAQTYTLYWKSTDGEKNITNMWMANDQAVCSTDNKADAETFNPDNTLWWALVKDAGHKYIGEVRYNYITLDWTTISGANDGEPKTISIPAVGDHVSMLGSRATSDDGTILTNRQNAIYMSSSSSLDPGLEPPLFGFYRGINDFCLKTHRKTHFAPNSSAIIAKEIYQGDDDEPMPIAVFLGEWTDTMTVPYGGIVTHNGTTWTCIAKDGCQGVEPTEANKDVWISNKGANGKNGTTYKPNLIYNSMFDDAKNGIPAKWVNWSEDVSKATIEMTTEGDVNVLHVKSDVTHTDGSHAKGIGQTAQQKYDQDSVDDALIKPDTDYTLSVWAKGSGLLNFGVHCMLSDGSNETQDWLANHVSDSDRTLGDTWKRYVFTFHTSANSAGVRVMLGSFTATTLDVYIMHPKLEEGTEATDWTPAAVEMVGKDGSSPVVYFFKLVGGSSIQVAKDGTINPATITAKLYKKTGSSEEAVTDVSFICYKDTTSSPLSSGNQATGCSVIGNELIITTANVPIESEGYNFIRIVESKTGAYVDVPVVRDGEQGESGNRMELVTSPAMLTFSTNSKGTIQSTSPTIVTVTYIDHKTGLTSKAVLSSIESVTGISSDGVSINNDDKSQLKVYGSMVDKTTEGDYVLPVTSGLIVFSAWAGETLLRGQIAFHVDVTLRDRDWIQTDEELVSKYTEINNKQGTLEKNISEVKQTAESVSSTVQKIQDGSIDYSKPHNTQTLDLGTDADGNELDESYFYPACFDIRSHGQDARIMTMEVRRPLNTDYNSTDKPSFCTDERGFSLNMVWTDVASRWSRNKHEAEVSKYDKAYIQDSVIIAKQPEQMEPWSIAIAYLRGGSKYKCTVDAVDCPIFRVMSVDDLSNILHHAEFERSLKEEDWDSLANGTKIYLGSSSKTASLSTATDMETVEEGKQFILYGKSTDAGLFHALWVHVNSTGCLKTQYSEDGNTWQSTKNSDWDYYYQRYVVTVTAIYHFHPVKVTSKEEAQTVTNGLESKITQTASKITAEVDDLKTGLKSVGFSVDGTDWSVNTWGEKFCVYATKEDAANKANPVMYVDTDSGTLYVKNGNFSGTITATSGKIGAWQIDSQGLKADYNSGAYINIEGSSNFFRLSSTANYLLSMRNDNGGCIDISCYASNSTPAIRVLHNGTGTNTAIETYGNNRFFSRYNEGTVINRLSFGSVTTTSTTVTMDTCYTLPGTSESGYPANFIICQNLSSEQTVKLPSSPTVGQFLIIVQATGKRITINGNGHYFKHGTHTHSSQTFYSDTDGQWNFFLFDGTYWQCVYLTSNDPW